MKKLILVMFVLCSISLVSQAQDRKFWVGGNFKFMGKDNDGDNFTKEISIKPEFGYNFNDNWAAGLQIGFTSEGGYKSTVNGFIVSPFARYFYCKTKTVNLFVDGFVSYHNFLTNESDVDHYSIQGGFRPGLNINLSQKIALTGKFGFLGYKHIKQDEDKKNEYGLDFDMDTYEVGIIFKF